MSTFLGAHHSEYLLATLLFDGLEKLIKAKKISNKDDTSSEYQRAIDNWFLITEAGRETSDIANFIVDEAELRLGEFEFSEWNLALEIIEDILYLRPDPTVTLFQSESGSTPLLKSFNKIERLKKSCLTIFTLWGCLNRSRMENHGTIISFSELNFDEHNLKFLQGLNNSITDVTNQKVEKENEFFENLPGTQNSFLGFGLSGLDIDTINWDGFFISGGDMNFTFFSGTQIRRSVFHSLIMQDCVFNQVDMSQGYFYEVHLIREDMEDDAGENFIGGKISHSVFREGSFIKIICDGTDFRFSDFSEMAFENCVFNTVNFSFCEISSSSFDGCTFKNCKFENSDISASGFDQCTFVKCDFDRTKIPSDADKGSDFLSSEINKFVECTGLPLI